MEQTCISPLIEPIGVQEIFVAGLGEVENIGGECYRFSFYTDQSGERVINLKLIALRKSIRPAIILTAKTAGFQFFPNMIKDLAQH